MYRSEIQADQGVWSSTSLDAVVVQWLFVEALFAVLVIACSCTASVSFFTAGFRRKRIAAHGLNGVHSNFALSESGVAADPKIIFGLLKQIRLCCVKSD